jgi:adenosylmethionine-8-amino-7-oxononanoate aminotransferase
VLTRTLATGALHVSPPLIITEDELDELAAATERALDHVAAEKPVRDRMYGSTRVRSIG